MTYHQYGDDQRHFHHPQTHWAPPTHYQPMRMQETATTTHEFGRAPHLQVHIPPYGQHYRMHPALVPQHARGQSATAYYPPFYEQVAFQPALAPQPYSAPPYPTARFQLRISNTEAQRRPLPRFYPGPQVQPVFEPVTSRVPPEFQTNPARSASSGPEVHLGTGTSTPAQKPDTAPFPVTPPLTASPAQKITSPQALPGSPADGSAPHIPSAQKSLIVKLPVTNWPPSLRSTSVPASDSIKVNKRKQPSDGIEPSCAGADGDQLQPATELQPDSNTSARDFADDLGSSRKKLRSSKTRDTSTPAQVADASDTAASPAHAGAVQATSSAGSLTPITTGSPDMQATEMIQEDATESQMLPTPPSERDEPVSKTPTPHTRLGVRQFSPGLYGREQPKRRAKRELEAPKRIPKRRPSLQPDQAHGSSVSVPQIDGATDDLVPNTRGSKRKRANQKRDQASEKRAPLNSTAAKQTPEITMGAILATPARAQPAVPIPTYSMPESVRPSLRESSGDVRAIPDPFGDRDFVQKMVQVLQEQTDSETTNVQKASSYRILNLLQKAKFPAMDEAKFLSGKEAEAAVATNVFFNGPIVTAEQQKVELQTPSQFLDEFYEQDAQIWIQDSSTGLARNQVAVRQVKISQVKERLENAPTEAPWNCLELATHHDEGLRPVFLQSEDCRLLTKLKIPGAADHTRRRSYPQGYKEVEKWALLAEAGALTTPHQDSHGYSTFITVNHGLVGFGWLSNPTAEERAGWCKNPQSYSGGRWRYIVLKPSQTVYFPAGTVHMVFRHPDAGHTLAFGGHVLRNSNIVHWVKTLLEERENTNVTNEDLTESSTGYLDRVEKFVKEAIQRGDTEKWGGMGSIEEFLKLKGEFDKPKSSPKHGKKTKQANKSSAKTT